MPATDRSIPKTRPADPTSLAVKKETSPTPHPQSSTLMPRLMPARCITCSVTSAISRDWLTNRRSSHAASPRTYCPVVPDSSMADETWPRREFCSIIAFESSVGPASRKLCATGNQHQNLRSSVDSGAADHRPSSIRKGLDTPSFRVSRDVWASHRSLGSPKVRERALP